MGLRARRRLPDWGMHRRMLVNFSSSSRLFFFAAGGEHELFPPLYARRTPLQKATEDLRTVGRGQLVASGVDFCASAPEEKLRGVNFLSNVNVIVHLLNDGGKMMQTVPTMAGKRGARGAPLC